MPAYAYPIIIKREPQEIQFTKDIRITSDWLTLEKLREHIAEDDKFEIYENDISQMMITVLKKRLETPEETAARIEREENYMVEYNKRQNK